MWSSKRTIILESIEISSTKRYIDLNFDMTQANFIIVGANDVAKITSRLTETLIHKNKFNTYTKGFVTGGGDISIANSAVVFYKVIDGNKLEYYSTNRNTDNNTVNATTEIRIDIF